ncbi:hypothetical protein [Leifsonia sp. 1010]|uniref:hypothetical protein n=1 Tax=Leifsonia sp. 1010 TaxID=2817769 RepID=UPI00285525A8|nr:hypothetical protein [Leifsonia sp. 1010]MDR6610699.1 hypothetical protein [Leifsonia sp. 1010]
MKHVTFAEKSLLIGNEAADLLMQYARLISEQGGSDVVTVRAIGVDGNVVDASFLLNSATVLMVESASTDATEPDNREAVEYLRNRTEELSQPFGLPSDL